MLETHSLLYITPKTRNYLLLDHIYDHLVYKIAGARDIVAVNPYHIRTYDKTARASSPVNSTPLTVMDDLSFSPRSRKLPRYPSFTFTSPS
jgi:hypothetical protein